MSERLLEAFREEAEQHTRVPSFETIEAAGRRRRLRRQAAVGAVTACVLGASGLLAATYGDSADPQPAEDSDESSLGTPYPVMTNTTLEAGTYVLHPSRDTSLPPVRFTLPAGWNSWLGPNRFAGLDDVATDGSRTNPEVLVQDPEWLLGMVFLDVQWIAQPGCVMTDLTGDGTTIDAWVIDVDGRPLLLWAVWTAGTPDAEVQDLLGVVDSVEVQDR